MTKPIVVHLEAT